MLELQNNVKSWHSFPILITDLEVHTQIPHGMSSELLLATLSFLFLQQSTGTALLDQQNLTDNNLRTLLCKSEGNEHFDLIVSLLLK